MAMSNHLCRAPLISAVLAAAVHAQVPAGSTRSTGDPARIEHMLRPVVHIADRPDTAFDLVDRMRLNHVPGVSLAIIDNFKIVFARGYGVTEFGGSKQVDTTTLFLAGSMSKPVFASGVLQLVEQGKLALDEDINVKLKSWHLPDSRFTEHEKVTLRRLLTHSAGLTVWGFPGYEVGKPVPTVPQLLDGAPPANTAAVRNDTTPGARWLYSGGGITIAQLAASDVTGEDFPSLMRRLVLSRAGMTRSTYENPLPKSREPEAASGHERIDTPVPGRFHIYPEMAAAGLWTTAPELARWALSLTHSYNGDAPGLLSPAMARQMISKQVHQGPQYGSGFWGLGVQVAGDGDSIQFTHGGRDEGFVANFIMWPKLGRGIFVMTNGVNGALLAELSRAFAEVYGMPAPPRVERRAVAMDSAALAPLAGRFMAVQGRDTAFFDVTAVGSRLNVYDGRANRSAVLWPEGSDVFFDGNTGGRIKFIREGDAGSRARAMALGTAPNAPTAVRVP
jgi:CubicO group peptidase (beta-lactamase class C family)